MELSLGSDGACGFVRREPGGVGWGISRPRRRDEASRIVELE